MCLVLLRDKNLDHWRKEIKKFHFTDKMIKELKESVQKTLPQQQSDQFLKDIQKAKYLSERRNDIVHSLWNMPVTDLFGSIPLDFMNQEHVAKALRIPAEKKNSEYCVIYSAKQIEDVAKEMGTLTKRFAVLRLEAKSGES